MGFPLGSALSFYPMEGFPPGSARGFSPLTIITAFVRGGRFGRRCAVLPRNMLLCLIPSCDQSSTWGYLCANGRTGHAVGVALVLSDAPFNLKLAITVTRVSADPVCFVLCLGPALTGYSVKDLHRNTSQSGAIVFKRAPRALRSKYSDKSLDQRMSEVCYCMCASAVPL